MVAARDIERLGFYRDALRALPRRAVRAAQASQHSPEHRSDSRFQGVDREFRRAGTTHNRWPPS
jgi:hypothetical protein